MVSINALMTHIRVCLALSCIVACRGGLDARVSSTPASSGRDTLPLVVIDRPTVIGFFPPARDSIEEAGDGYSEGLAHLEFALQDAEACLGKDSSRVALVVDG